MSIVIRISENHNAHLFTSIVIYKKKTSLIYQTQKKDRKWDNEEGALKPVELEQAPFCFPLLL